MEIKTKALLYEDLKKGLTFEYDKYDVLSYQYETRKNTLLANPNLKDLSSLYMVVGTADDMIIACTTRFSTLFKCDNVLVEANSGTYYYVKQEFRKDPIGAELFLFKDKKHKVDFSISAGISDMAIPFHKVTKHEIFQFPKYWQIRRTQSIIKKIGIEGKLVDIIASVFNFPLLFIKKWQMFSKRGILKTISIEQVDIVPEWVDDVVLNDGHKYMEVHDHKWLQWNLNYNFCGGNNNYQNFFIIKREGNPVGFFMLKFRQYAEKWRMKDVTIASIVEWGICKGAPLTERDVIVLASKQIGNNVDVLELATTNNELAKTLKRHLFLYRGNANVSVKDKKKQIPDFNNMELWRLRLGYGDTILST